jgi:hypothetical protein
MHRALRPLVLACTLLLAPSCSALHLDGPQIVNPVSAARTPDQRAYALIEAYGALLETATDIIRNPDTPIEAKRAFGQAEAAATPALETLEIAFAAYLRAQTDFESAPSGNASALTRATSALATAAQHLSAAVDAAQTPVSELEALVRAH